MAPRTVVSRRERIRQFHEEQRRQDAEPGPAGPAPKPRRRRWLLWVPVLLLVVLFFLPGLVAHTPLLGWVLDQAMVDLKGELSVERVSLGWFSPIEAERIEVRDAAGQSVLTAEKLSGHEVAGRAAVGPVAAGQVSRPVARVDRRTPRRRQQR